MGWRCLVADHPGPREVEDSPVLRDHCIEEIEPFANPDQLEERSPGHEDEAQSGLPGLTQGGKRLRADPVLRRQSAVVVTR